MNLTCAPSRVSVANGHSLVIARQCIDGIALALARTRQLSHEGVVYLLGMTDSTTTVAVSSVLPDALTTPGSFNVSALSMSRVVRLAARAHLAIVGQVHSHPLQAFHSLGDFRGMRIRYPGYVSIVLPRYGEKFPDWKGTEILMCTGALSFVRLDVQRLYDIPAVAS